MPGLSRKEFAARPRLLVVRHVAQAADTAETPMIDMGLPHWLMFCWHCRRYATSRTRQLAREIQRSHRDVHATHRRVFVYHVERWWRA